MTHTAAFSTHWWEQPWDNSQSNWEPEKTFRERGGGQQTSLEQAGTDRLQWTMWLVSILTSLWASSSSCDLGLSPGAIAPPPQATIRSSEPAKQHNSPNSLQKSA